MEDAEATAVNATELKELQMANERRDDDQEPSAEVEQVRNDDDISREADPEDPEKVKDDEWNDDRFQATDN